MLMPPAVMRWVRSRGASGRFALGSAACGALAGFLLSALGVLDLIRLGESEGMLAGVLLGLALGFTGAANTVIVADLVLLGAYFTISLSPVVDGPLARWVREDSPPPFRVDAVVVLSSGVKPDSSLTASAVERLLAGLELMKAGLAPQLVVTSEMSVFGGHAVRSGPDQRRLIQLGGPVPSWSSVDSVRSTREEAIRVWQHLLPTGARRIALVTSPLHTRRACATFEAVGFLVYCVPSREIEYATRNPMTASDRLAGARSYLHERLGMVKYKWKGWLVSPKPAAK